MPTCLTVCLPAGLRFTCTDGLPACRPVLNLHDYQNIPLKFLWRLPVCLPAGLRLTDSPGARWVLAIGSVPSYTEEITIFFRKETRGTIHV